MNAVKKVTQTTEWRTLVGASDGEWSDTLIRENGSECADPGPRAQAASGGERDEAVVAMGGAARRPIDHRRLRAHTSQNQRRIHGRPDVQIGGMLKLVIHAGHADEVQVQRQRFLGRNWAEER